jgi:hypothetical protein
MFIRAEFKEILFEELEKWRNMDHRILKHGLRNFQ